MHSDEWKAYNEISELPHMSSHEVLNHSVYFVNPASGVHTQNLKSYWNNAKQKLKRMKGCHGEQHRRWKGWDYGAAAPPYFKGVS